MFIVELEKMFQPVPKVNQFLYEKHQYFCEYSIFGFAVLPNLSFLIIMHSRDSRETYIIFSTITSMGGVVD